MNSIAVIYKSKYGTTKQYAEWIADALGAALYEASTVKPSQLSTFDIVVFGGGLYAGGIDGIKLVKSGACKSLVVFTVGLADPTKTDYSVILDRNFSKDLQSRIKVFHLHGGMDYAALSFVHKLAMRFVRRRALTIAESERTQEDQLFLQTYGTKLDFTNREAIAPIVRYVTDLSTHSSSLHASLI
ncbi:MAG: flavodoxin domain-containing protein [Clostridiales bacterium]|nr:flavodoxin domain-containing protein [Clostridiales bacterium]